MIIATVRSGRTKLQPLWVRARKLARGAVFAVDPAPRILVRRVQLRPTRGVLACIYRSDRVQTVQRLMGAARRANLTPALWSLGEPDPALAGWTIGSGPGGRQELLNRLIEAAPATDCGRGSWLVLADDDVEVSPSALSILFAAADATGLDVVQPGHDSRSWAATEHVRAQPGVLARRTGFVEIGPLVAMRESLRPALLPLDESLGMGWGQDHMWARYYSDHGIRVGIIDGVRMRHLGRAGAGYDVAAARQQLNRCLERSGYTSFRDPMVTYERWWPWQPRPWRT
jgi:hypothetical protein